MRSKTETPAQRDLCDFVVKFTLYPFNLQISSSGWNFGVGKPADESSNISVPNDSPDVIIRPTSNEP